MVCMSSALPSLPAMRNLACCQTKRARSRVVKYLRAARPRANQNSEAPIIIVLSTSKNAAAVRSGVGRRRARRPRRRRPRPRRRRGRGPAPPAHRPERSARPRNGQSRHGRPPSRSTCGHPEARSGRQLRADPNGIGGGAAARGSAVDRRLERSDAVTAVPARQRGRLGNGWPGRGALGDAGRGSVGHGTPGGAGRGQRRGLSAVPRTGVGGARRGVARQPERVPHGHGAPARRFLTAPTPTVGAPGGAMGRFRRRVPVVPCHRRSAPPAQPRPQRRRPGCRGGQQGQGVRRPRQPAAAGTRRGQRVEPVDWPATQRDSSSRGGGARVRQRPVGRTRRPLGRLRRPSSSASSHQCRPGRVRPPSAALPRRGRRRPARQLVEPRAGETEQVVPRASPASASWVCSVPRLRP